MEQVVWGYVRVSTREQNEDRQMIAMSEFDVPRSHIYMDKMSGKDFERPAYRKLLKRMKAGHLLVIKSIDRLGRNYDEILEQWRIITKEKKVEVVVLDMPLLDTRQGRDLTGTLIADIVLQLLSYVAQTERENIRQRQAEGIAAAKLRGVKFGRPPKPVPPDFYTLRTQWLAGEITSRKAAAQIGVAQDTFLRWVRLKPELRKSPEEILIENNDGNIEHCGDTQPHQVRNQQIHAHAADMADIFHQKNKVYDESGHNKERGQGLLREEEYRGPQRV
ncbi:hypothetical protein CE91St36_21880 [Christensenellaceae bacterium]|nr:hypothetical protein CE91St36_21880 [Christensenellaceae bacterium]BDF62036.1 hypothetical protein CE91St37_21860 [Christensenellaceae bacterium]